MGSIGLPLTGGGFKGLGKQKGASNNEEDTDPLTHGKKKEIRSKTGERGYLKCASEAAQQNMKKDRPAPLFEKRKWERTLYQNS